MQAIKVDITFHVAEVVELTGEWAFARTTSTGTITILATGARVPEANQELFLFKKAADGMWKIARYSFSVMNPPTQQ
jgi:ketosteroid isomerase-like protein